MHRALSNPQMVEGDRSASSIRGEGENLTCGAATETLPTEEVRLATERLERIKIGREQERPEHANLDDREPTSERNSPSRSAMRMRRESEAERREREEAWEVFQGKKIAEIHATERHLFGLNEETNAVAANLEKLREERRQEEARIERLKLEREEREWREQRAEEDRRAYDEQLLRLEEQRREIARQIAREREQASPDFTRPHSASRQARIASVWEDERPPTTFRRSGTSSQTYTVPSSAALVSNLELEEHSADRHVAQPTAGSHSAANLEGIQSQPNPTTSIFSNLSSSVHPSTSATSAPIYVPPWRRQNGPQPQTGSGHSRTSVSAAQAATRGISFP